jgi:hypothetical protein
MPVEDTRPAPVERPAPPRRSERPAERPSERRPSRQPSPAADDDLGLGKLQGGVKPGDRKSEPKKH